VWVSAVPGGDGTIALTWQPVEAGARVVVQRRMHTGAAWLPLTSWLEATTTFEDRLPPEATPTYRLRAMDTIGNRSAWSSEITP
jgi:hypothetical protein